MDLNNNRFRHREIHQNVHLPFDALFLYCHPDLLLFFPNTALPLFKAYWLDWQIAQFAWPIPISLAGQLWQSRQEQRNTAQSLSSVFQSPVNIFRVTRKKTQGASKKKNMSSTRHLDLNWMLITCPRTFCQCHSVHLGVPLTLKVPVTAIDALRHFETG